jgi:hypothetical protein
MKLKELVAVLAGRVPGGFEGAVAELRQKVGGDGRLSDVAVFLGSDLRTVTLWANWSDDAKTVGATFVLPEVISEDDFNSNVLREAIDELPNGH